MGRNEVGYFDFLKFYSLMTHNLKKKSGAGQVVGWQISTRKPLKMGRVSQRFQVINCLKIIIKNLPLTFFLGFCCRGHIHFSLCFRRRYPFIYLFIYLYCSVLQFFK